MIEEDRVEELVQRALVCAKLADDGRTKLGHRELYENRGMSGLKVRSFLNFLCWNDLPKFPPWRPRYLEVGLLRGSTFFSALHGNTIVACGIDDWSEFSGPRADFEDAVVDYVGGSDVEVFNCDFRKTPAENPLPGPFDLYFYDGGHSRGDQSDALLAMWCHLAPVSIFVVDDANQEEVRLGTSDAMSALAAEGRLARVALDLTLGGGPAGSHDAEGWWDGVRVLVLAKGP